MRATARVFAVDLHTVLPWLVEAAEQLQAFTVYLLCAIHVRQLHLDEVEARLGTAVPDGGLQGVRHGAPGPWRRVGATAARPGHRAGSKAPADACAAAALCAGGGKTMRRRRRVAVKPRVGCGTREAVGPVLAACGWQSQPAFVERLTLDRRPRGAAIRRRVHPLGQGADGVRHPLALCQGYHNLVLPHASVRSPLWGPAPTNDSGAAKAW
jgi:hypothetical protein